MDGNQDAVLVYARAKLAEKQKNYEQAIKDFARVLELDPSFYNAAYAKASCESIIGKYEDAIVTYNLAFAQDSEAPVVTSQQALSSCRSSRMGSPENQLHRICSKRRMDDKNKTAFRLKPMELLIDDNEAEEDCNNLTSHLNDQNKQLCYTTQEPPKTGKSYIPLAPYFSNINFNEELDLKDLKDNGEANECPMKNNST